ncbi:hypothetical protein SCHPADRAFT_860899 [Schizopora paradoxa]|uniref:Mtf2-like C-terminal domain-containing protein n=1 Tax=Schizopora paradoxa TaxID=27342 RepID=A0A0H2R4T9_9AGAM|nr:hypothetical protein SCHPADRAFT_860899 [Schizopora paradoxa]
MSARFKSSILRVAGRTARQQRSLPPKHVFRPQRLYTTEGGKGDEVQASASTSKAGPSSSRSEEPLFSTSGSAWDLVFQGIDDMAPPIASSSAGLAFPRKVQRPSQVPYPQDSRGTSSQRPARRQSMTASEIDAFDSMFNLIFQAVAENKPKDKLPASGTSSGIGARQFKSDGTKAAEEMTGEDDVLGTLYGKIRRRVGRTVKEDEELLDRKREQIELCATDHELLEWAMRELFDESVKYEQAAREAADQNTSSPSSSKDSEKSDPKPSLPSLQPPCYAALLALLMRTFREKYRDPHTALSLFAYAQRLSIASYVFGCTTPAYNELLQTRWACFRDLRGVADALTEMRVNGVQPDARTRALAEEVRREVGARNLWQEESGLGAGANESVFELLQKIEELSFKKATEPSESRGGNFMRGHGGRRRNGSKRWTAGLESWKNDASSGDEGNDYKFGDWSFSSERRTSSRY